MKLREARRRKLYSMRALAEEAGVGSSTIYMIEAGKTIPRLFIIRKMVKVLNVDPLEIDEFRAAIEGGTA